MIFWVIIGVLVLIAILLLEAWLGERFRKPEYEYKAREYIMSLPEHKCFDALTEAVGDRYLIFPQIHLPTILRHDVGNQNSWGAFRHIDEKSVDFVLCDKQKISPKLAIELDDRSHDRPDRQVRDREVERIFRDARMPLLRLRGSEVLSVIELKQRVDSAITTPVV